MLFNDLVMICSVLVMMWSDWVVLSSDLVMVYSERATICSDWVVIYNNWVMYGCWDCVKVWDDFSVHKIRHYLYISANVSVNFDSCLINRQHLMTCIFEKTHSIMIFSAL